MKNIFIISTLLAASVTAFADQNNTSGANQSTSVTSGANASANNQGVIGAIYNTPANTTSAVTSSSAITGGTSNQDHIDYGTQIVRNTPSVTGSPLVSSNDTCMGSASGSANGPGFGISVGKTYIDTNCVMLKNSRELWNMGMKAAAMARMCTDAANKEALELTGFVCPQTRKALTDSSAVIHPEYTDPIIRARLGLPAISSNK